MLDMSWGEIMVIGAVALIVIGPKDLRKALGTLGQITGKVGRMAAEFQDQFNEAMSEAELDEVKKQIDDMNQSVAAVNTGFNPIQTVRSELKGAIEARPAAAAATATSGIPTPMIGPDAHSNPADPVDLPSVDLPVVPLPPREPHLPVPPPPAQPDLPPFDKPAVKSPPA